MALGELRFNGSNGHSKILRVPDREAITSHLIWVSDLKLLHLPQTKCENGESQKTYQMRIIESQSPLEAMYFARSEEVDKHLGVQYYRLAEPGVAGDERIPIGMPTIVDIGNHRNDNSAIQRLINFYRPTDAIDYVKALNNVGKLAVIQYYKLRPK